MTVHCELPYKFTTNWALVLFYGYIKGTNPLNDNALYISIAFRDKDVGQVQKHPGEQVCHCIYNTCRMVPIKPDLASLVVVLVVYALIYFFLAYP